LKNIGFLLAVAARFTGLPLHLCLRAGRLRAVLPVHAAGDACLPAVYLPSLTLAYSLFEGARFAGKTVLSINIDLSS